MNLSQVVNVVDSLKPNTFTYEQKVGWLSDMDLQVFHEIFATHENPPVENFSGYTPSTPGDTELLVPAPYDALYAKYLCSQMDYYNNELARYNNSAVMFNLSYMNYYNYYNRTHKPKGAKLRS